MKHTTIMIVDGIGGGIGAQCISKLKEIIENGTEIIALGTNSLATDRMIKAGASRGTTGENAIRVLVVGASFILGLIGIVISNSMLGEITPDIAGAILTAPGERFLLPIQQGHFYIPGLEPMPLVKMIDKAIEILMERLKARTA